jgi:predicted O-methyltransferase YrrM
LPWYGSHPYLNEYIIKYNCRKLMEVGVYNGDNAVNMIKAATNYFNPKEVEYVGFDFFSHYSLRRVGLKLEETGCSYRLVEGDTMITLPKEVNTLPPMDLIFLDGGKSFAEAVSDWRYSSQLMHGLTGVFVHNVDFPGVYRMVEGISRDDYLVRVFHAPSEGSVALVTCVDARFIDEN